MPIHNQFRHQRYQAEAPSAPYELVTAKLRAAPEEPAFAITMREVGDAMRTAGVRHVYLVHGTFAGTDGMGLIGELERFVPRRGRILRKQLKRMIDSVADDAGNFTREYAGQLEEGLGRDATPEIQVHRFRWSSENHHLSRADAAVRLIDQLVSRADAGQRILLCGHSHAGNVFALMTNLLVGDEETRGQFFDAARLHYLRPWSGTIEFPVWGKVRKLLDNPENPLVDTPLDMVTFGTPIRYGWDTRGYSQLLHFISHRPSDHLPEYRTAFPPGIDDLTRAAAGDYVQQMAIAGTNLFPSIFAWRTWLPEARMKRLVQRGIRNRDVVRHLMAGKRVPDEGRTLLVNYHAAEPRLAAHLFGHTIYTRIKWLTFHLEEIAKRFYGFKGPEP